MNKIKKITNKTLAIHAAVPAIPENPKIAATIAIIKKIKAQESIIFFSGMALSEI